MERASKVDCRCSKVHISVTLPSSVLTHGKRLVHGEGGPAKARQKAKGAEGMCPTMEVSVSISATGFWLSFLLPPPTQGHQLMSVFVAQGLNWQFSFRGFQGIRDLEVS